MTYGREPLASGPDEVGSHPASDSPFGLRDVHGNALEIVRSAKPSAVAVGYGGSWYYDHVSARVNNRGFPLDRTTRSAVTGLRLCADIPAP